MGGNVVRDGDRPLQHNGLLLGEEIQVNPLAEGVLVRIYAAVGEICDGRTDPAAPVSVHLEQRSILAHRDGFTGHQVELRLLIGRDSASGGVEHADQISRLLVKKVFGEGPDGHTAFAESGGVFESAKYHADNITHVVCYHDVSAGEIRNGADRASYERVKIIVHVAPNTEMTAKEAGRLNPKPHDYSGWSFSGSALLPQGEERQRGT